MIGVRDNDTISIHTNSSNGNTTGKHRVIVRQ